MPVIARNEIQRSRFISEFAVPRDTIQVESRRPMHLPLFFVGAVASSSMAIWTTATADVGAAKFQVTGDSSPIVVVAQESKRQLRASESYYSSTEGTGHHRDWVKNPRDGQVFVEHVLHRALTDPRKMTRLFNKWYDDGYSAEEISAGLYQHASRDLEEAFEGLRANYVKFVRVKESSNPKYQ